MCKKYNNIPKYIAHDLWKSGTTMDWLEDKKIFYNWFPQLDFCLHTTAYFHQMALAHHNKIWKLELIDFHWSKLDSDTKNNFLKRKFGLLNPDKVYRDASRFEQQKKMVIPEKNEPVVMFYDNGLYDLQEGFHRTIEFILLSSGNREKTLKQISTLSDEEMEKMVNNFPSIKIRAWIGYGTNGHTPATMGIPLNAINPLAINPSD